jgi:hypothetical protein
MTTPRDLVGESHFSLATRGVARMIAEDVEELDKPIGVDPWTGPGERRAAYLGALLDTGKGGGGVTVVDDGNLQNAAYNMTGTPGVLVAFASFDNVLPNSPQGRQSDFGFTIRVTLKAAPVEQDDDTQVKPVDLVSLITGRVTGDRFGLLPGRIPYPADIEPTPAILPGEVPKLTRCLSHGILRATAVGPATLETNLGSLLRYDMDFTFSMASINNAGRLEIQRDQP